MKGVINWCADKLTEFEGKKSLKFKIGSDFCECIDLKETSLELIKLGNEIEFDELRGKASNIKLIKKGEVKEKSKYMVKIGGKDYLGYPGLLDKAHRKDPNFSMVITESFVSEDMTRAWCKVRLTNHDASQIFDGFGSSTPENTGKMTQSHPIEMAHTRAKGRALRDFVNIGEVMAEELK